MEWQSVLALAVAMAVTFILLWNGRNHAPEYKSKHWFFSQSLHSMWYMCLVFNSVLWLFEGNLLLGIPSGVGAITAWNYSKFHFVHESMATRWWRGTNSFILFLIAHSAMAVAFLISKNWVLAFLTALATFAWWHNPGDDGGWDDIPTPSTPPVGSKSL